MSQIKPGTPHAIGLYAAMMEQETEVRAVKPEFADPADALEWERGYEEGFLPDSGLYKAEDKDKQNA